MSRRIESVFTACGRTGGIAVLSATLLLTACGTKGSESAGGFVRVDCDPITVNMEGEGPSRSQAIADAQRRAAARELGELVTYESVLINDRFNDASGYATRGEVVSAKLLDTLEYSAGNYRVMAEVTLCRRNAVIANTERSVDAQAASGLQTKIRTMLDEAGASRQNQANQKVAFSNVVAAGFRPLGRYAVHDFTVLESRAVIASDDHTVVDMQIQARIAITPATREYMRQLLDTVTIKRRSPGMLGSNYRSIIKRPGFVDVDQRLEQPSNPYIAASDLMKRPPERYRSEFDTLSSIRILRTHHQLLDWQATEIARQVHDVVEDFIGNPPELVGWSEDGRRVLSVPLAQKAISGRRISDGNARLSMWSRLSIYPESSRGKVSRTNVVSVTPRWTDGTDQESATRWLLKQMTPLSDSLVARTGTSLPSMRQGDTRIELRFRIPEYLARQVDRFTLERTGGRATLLPVSSRRNGSS